MENVNTKQFLIKYVVIALLKYKKTNQYLLFDIKNISVQDNYVI